MVRYLQDSPAGVGRPAEEQARGVTISSTTKEEPRQGAAPGRRGKSESQEPRQGGAPVL